MRIVEVVRIGQVFWSDESFAGCQSWADRCYGLAGCIGCGSRA